MYMYIHNTHWRTIYMNMHTVTLVVNVLASFPGRVAWEKAMHELYMFKVQCL